MSSELVRIGGDGRSLAVYVPRSFEYSKRILNHQEMSVLSVALCSESATAINGLKKKEMKLMLMLKLMLMHADCGMYVWYVWYVTPVYGLPNRWPDGASGGPAILPGRVT